MHSFPVRLVVIALALSVAATGPLRADYTSWSYSTSAVPPGFSVTTVNGSGAVQLTPFTNVAGAGSINVLAYQTSATTPVAFNAQNSTYTLTITIKDGGTNDTGDVMFKGAVDGDLTRTTSSVVNTFSTLSQSLTLDGHTYLVTLPASVALLDPTHNQQNIMASVSVTNAGSGGGISGVPEPASCLLSGLGFAAFGAAGWWKRLRRMRRTV